MISARRVGDFPSNTESANQNVANGNAGNFNESSQSENKNSNLLGFKRKIEELSTEDSPSSVGIPKGTQSGYLRLPCQRYLKIGTLPR
jgi:hypothetical protein